MNDSAQERVLGRRSLLRTVPALAAAAIVAPAMLGQASSVSAQSTPDSSDGNEIVRSITVTGTGIVNVKPDVATIAVGVAKSGASLQETQNAVTDVLNAMLKTIKDAGIADKDVVTSGYNVYPVPKYDNDGNYVGVDRYQVSSDLTVTVRKIDTVGTLLDDIVSAGANQVWGISFSVDDPAAPASEARKAAVADARKKADELATAAGAVVTGVITIAETSAPAPKSLDYAAPAAAGEMARDSAPVPVSTGTTDIEVDVQVVFQIEVAAG